MEKDLRTDVELIDACLAGDDDSFAELVDRYKNLVYSIILKQTRDKEEANDLAQDVFLKVFKNLASYTSEYKFSTWLMRITGNHIIDQHRKRRMELVSLEEYVEAGNQVGSSDSPEHSYLKQEQAEAINKILDELPEMYKVPVALYHQQELSYAEISEKIGEPLSKVKNRIFRGRKMLKDLLAFAARG